MSQPGERTPLLGLPGRVTHISKPGLLRASLRFSKGCDPFKGRFCGHEPTLVEKGFSTTPENELLTLVEKGSFTLDSELLTFGTLVERGISTLERLASYIWSGRLEPRLRSSTRPSSTECSASSSPRPSRCMAASTRLDGVASSFL